MATVEKPELAEYRDRMSKAAAALKEESSSLRTGRASANLLDQISVDAYGSQMPLNQVGAIPVRDRRMISVSVWDKALVTAVEKAIRSSNLGLNPVTDGHNLRIPIPPLTEDRRKELVKIAGKYAEQQRIAVRNIRRDANEDLRAAEKAHVISQDEEKRMETEVQKLTDEAIRRVDETFK